MTPRSQRVQRVFTFDVAAPPEQVFPLLCPVREREWLDGWSAEMVYAVSGVAEDHAVFVTDFPDRGRATWVVSHHDPVRLEIGFTIFHAGDLVERLDIALAPDGSGGTTARWTRTYTALDEAGIKGQERATGESLDARMAWVEAALRHYCATGTCLRR
jgi:polyketide cyclase/dehydrase/lipid transport protein